MGWDGSSYLATSFPEALFLPSLKGERDPGIEVGYMDAVMISLNNLDC